MLSDSDLDRYSRQVIMPQFGEEGQKKLMQAKVLLVGLGGLGCPAATYMALAGIGHIDLVDDDLIELSNLPRQSLYEEADIGRPKAVVAAEKLHFLNGQGRYTAHHARFAADAEYCQECTLWVDASDNFTSRAEIARGAAVHNRTLVLAAAQGFQGFIATVGQGETDSGFEGIFPTAPSDAGVSRCEQIGVLGAVTGVIGAMLAQEVIKEILSVGQGLRNEILLYDGMFARVQKIKTTN